MVSPNSVFCNQLAILHRLIKYPVRIFLKSVLMIAIYEYHHRQNFLVKKTFFYGTLNSHRLNNHEQIRLCF